MSSESRPPTLIETIRDADLSTLFLRFLLETHNDIGVTEMIFVKRALCFSLFRRTHREVIDEAQRLCFGYVSDASLHPVPLSDSVRDRIVRCVYDPTRGRKIDNLFFADAAAECIEKLRPFFDEFLASEKWLDAPSYTRIEPPSVVAVARHRALRASFQSFMTSQADSISVTASSLSLPEADEDKQNAGAGTGRSTGTKGKKKHEGSKKSGSSEGSGGAGEGDDGEEGALVKSEEIAPGVYSVTTGLWDFIVKGEKLRSMHELDARAHSSSSSRASDGCDAKSISSKDHELNGGAGVPKNSHEGSSGSSAGDEKSTTSGKTNESVPASEDSDNAKRLYKKFRKLLPVSFKGEGSLSQFLVDTLDCAIKSTAESEVFKNWIAAGSWAEIPFPPPIQQSATKEGLLEIPTLAAVLTGPLADICMAYFPQTTVSIQFLKDVYAFMEGLGAVPASPGSDNAAAASSNSSSKKSIKNQARAIYDKYFAGGAGSIKFPRDVADEVKAAVSGLSSSKVNSHVFQKSGSWVYYRMVNSLLRDFLATTFWVEYPYDNHSPMAEAMYQEFNRECLVGIPLDLEPSIDDVIINPRLLQSFCEYLPQSDGAAFISYLTRVLVLHSSGKTSLSKSEAESLMVLLSSCSRQDMPEIAALYKDARTQLDAVRRSASSTEFLASSPFEGSATVIIRYVGAEYLESWIEDCRGDFENIPWESAQSLRCDTRGPEVLVARARNPDVLPSTRRGLRGTAGGAGTSSSSGSATADDADNNTASTALSETGTEDAEDGTPDASGRLRLRKPRKGGREGVEGSQLSNEITGSQTQSRGSIPSAGAVLPRIPRIEQTLQSSLMRALFEEQVLGTALREEEMAAWKAFDGFFNKYSTLKDDQFADSQEAMHKDAQDIFEKHWKLMPHSDYIRSRLAKGDYITHLFFLEEESKMFAPQHAKFEGILKHAGWRKQN